MPAPIQTYSAAVNISLASVDPASPSNRVINGVTIAGNYTLLASGKFSVTVSTSGRTSEMGFAFSGTALTQVGAEQLTRALVDLAYDQATALPAIP